jgi:hypothetical protein
MRKAVVVLLCACALAACRPREVATNSSSQTPENEAKKNTVANIRLGLAAPIEKVLLGAQLGPDGAVSQEADRFEPGQTVYLTLRLRDSPVGLKTNAVWYGPDQKKILVEQKEMNGAKIATFVMNRKLPAGRYHVEGHWGGNFVDDKSFEIVASTKKRPS